MLDRLKKYLQDLYLETVQSKDSPQRIALSFGIGVFLGILPFTGVLAAIAVAWYFKLNKAGAIIGSVITNTWLGFVVLGASIHLSCLFLGVNANDIQQKFHYIIKNLHWESLKDAFILKILLAVTIGYVLLSIFLSLIAYLFCWAFFCFKRPSR